jgi:hypothetical protein
VTIFPTGDDGFDPGPPPEPAPGVPPPSSSGEDLAALVVQVRTLFVALTALMVAVNGVVVAISGMRTGQQVQAVQAATDENRAQIREVGQKTEEVHKQVKQLDAAKVRPPPAPFVPTAPAEDDPGSGP